MWWTSSIAGGFLPVIGRIAGTGPQPLSGDDTREAVAAPSARRSVSPWTGATSTGRPRHCLGESSDPYSPYFAISGATTTTGGRLRCRSARQRSSADEAYAAAAAMKKQCQSSVSVVSNGR